MQIIQIVTLVHVPKNVVHKIQELLVEKIVFLQQALHGMCRMTRIAAAAISTSQWAVPLPRRHGLHAPVSHIGLPGSKDAE